MGMYGYIWVYLGIYGYLWVYICMYGNIWVYMGVYRYIASICIYKGKCGFIWYLWVCISM